MLALVLGMSVHAATGHDPLVGPTSSDDGLHHVPTAGRFFFSSPTRSSPSRFVSLLGLVGTIWGQWPTVAVGGWSLHLW